MTQTCEVLTFVVLACLLVINRIAEERRDCRDDARDSLQEKSSKHKIVQDCTNLSAEEIRAPLSARRT